MVRRDLERRARAHRAAHHRLRRRQHHLGRTRVIDTPEQPSSSLKRTGNQLTKASTVVRCHNLNIERIIDW